MANEFDCPACGAVLSAGGRSPGDLLTCTRCGAVLRVPDFEPVSYSPAPPSQRRPRRREDSEPQPKSGCGCWTILVAIGFLMLLGCGGLIGLVAFFGGPNWRVYESRRGGFKVDLPADPLPNMEELAAKNGPLPAGVAVEGTFLFTRLEEYRIEYADLPAGGQAVPKTVLDEAEKHIRSGPPPASILSTKDVTVSGFPGRELEVQVEGQFRLVRVIVSNDRVYTIVAGGPWSRRGNDRVRRFINSFEVTGGGGDVVKPVAPPAGDENPLPRRPKR